MMSIYELLIVISLILTIIGVVSLNKKIKVGEVSNAGLTNAEKTFTWIASVLSPLVAANGIIYYSLRKKYPIKAKQANKIGWISLILGILLNILLTGF